MAAQEGKTYWKQEAFRRLCQIFVRGHIFDAPGLIAIRHFVLRRMFSLGRGVLVGARFYFIRPHGLGPGELTIGNGTKLNHNVEIDYSGGVVIGEDVWISQNVLIETHAHRLARGPKEAWPTSRAPLVIENEVWIGANVLILPGVRLIGRGAVIGGGSVVTKDVEPWTVVAGSPARAISEREAF